MKCVCIFRCCVNVVVSFIDGLCGECVLLCVSIGLFRLIVMCKKLCGVSVC